MQGYEPKADPLLRGTFKDLALVGLIGATGQLALNWLWFPSSLGGLVVYWCAVATVALCGQRIAARRWPALAARLRQRASQRGLW